jgi:hypothetical protein
MDLLIKRKETAMGCKIDRWSAQSNGSGEDRVIKVSGDGECNQAGYELRLEPTNEGVVDDPEVVALRLVIEEKEAGAEVITHVHVETEVRGDPATRVRIDTSDGSEWVEVEEAY